MTQVENKIQKATDSNNPISGTIELTHVYTQVVHEPVIVNQQELDKSTYPWRIMYTRAEKMGRGMHVGDFECKGSDTSHHVRGNRAICENCLLYVEDPNLTPATG
jgi:hypothetical protein